MLYVIEVISGCRKSDIFTFMGELQHIGCWRKTLGELDGRGNGVKWKHFINDKLLLQIDELNILPKA